MTTLWHPYLGDRYDDDIIHTHDHYFALVDPTDHAYDVYAQYSALNRHPHLAPVNHHAGDSR